MLENNKTVFLTKELKGYGIIHVYRNVVNQLVGELRENDVQSSCVSIPGSISDRAL